MCCTHQPDFESKISTFHYFYYACRLNRHLDKESWRKTATASVTYKNILFLNWVTWSTRRINPRWILVKTPFIAEMLVTCSMNLSRGVKYAWFINRNNNITTSPFERVLQFFLSVNKAICFVCPFEPSVEETIYSISGDGNYFCQFFSETCKFLKIININSVVRWT